MVQVLDDDFGRCPVCGGVGKDHSDSGSEHSTEDHTGEGYKLHRYHGELMCQLCVKRKMAEDEDKIMQDKYRADQELRDRFGFRRTMED